MIEHIRREEHVKEASPSELAQGTTWGRDTERYEIIDGVRVDREPMGAFETVLAS